MLKLIINSYQILYTRLFGCQVVLVKIGCAIFFSNLNLISDVEKVVCIGVYAPKCLCVHSQHIYVGRDVCHIHQPEVTSFCVQVRLGVRYCCGIKFVTLAF